MQGGKNAFFHGAGANHPVIEAWPFLSHAVNPLLALLPQFPTFGKAEINNLVGLLEVAPSCPGLILNEGHRIGFEIVSAQSADIELSSAKIAGSDLTGVLQANSTNPLFLILGVEFYQQVNGVNYALKGGKANALSLVRISGV